MIGLNSVSIGMSIQVTPRKEPSATIDRHAEVTIPTTVDQKNCRGLRRHLAFTVTRLKWKKDNLVRTSVWSFRWLSHLLRLYTYRIYTCYVSLGGGGWLKSPPTPPTIICIPYQLNKQVEQSGEFINIKWMLVRLWLIRATNYGRWCRLCR